MERQSHLKGERVEKYRHTIDPGADVKFIEEMTHPHKHIMVLIIVGGNGDIARDMQYLHQGLILQAWLNFVDLTIDVCSTAARQDSFVYIIWTALPPLAAVVVRRDTGLPGESSCGAMSIVDLVMGQKGQVL